MSADNYYAVKADPETLRWHVCHGFMSDLESGIPAFRRKDDPGFEVYADAMSDAFDRGWSEYGVIREPVRLEEIATREQFWGFLMKEQDHIENLLEWMRETEKGR